MEQPHRFVMNEQIMLGLVRIQSAREMHQNLRIGLVEMRQTDHHRCTDALEQAERPRPRTIVRWIHAETLQTRVSLRSVNNVPNAHRETSVSIDYYLTLASPKSNVYSSVEMPAYFDGPTYEAPMLKHSVGSYAHKPSAGRNRGGNIDASVP